MTIQRTLSGSYVASLKAMGLTTLVYDKSGSIVAAMFSTFDADKVKEVNDRLMGEEYYFIVSISEVRPT